MDEGKLFTPNKEDRRNPYKNEQYLDARDFNDAVEKYKNLGWLKDKDENGRRFIGIQASDDGFKTTKGRWFYDNQRYNEK